jgi:hypothetical protein
VHCTSSRRGQLGISGRRGAAAHVVNFWKKRRTASSWSFPAHCPTIGSNKTAEKQNLVDAMLAEIFLQKKGGCP